MKNLSKVRVSIFDGSEDEELTEVGLVDIGNIFCEARSYSLETRGPKRCSLESSLDLGLDLMAVLWG